MSITSFSQTKDIRKGDEAFVAKTYSIAKEYYNTACEEIEESEQKLINEYLSQEILGIEPLEERIKIMNNVLIFFIFNSLFSGFISKL